ncbi:transmembrane protein 179B [Megalops cyprinoides]|uniref:transmembrane protein 179B n=1 Tax=Megalops cyprinoides TaxID=118141 RepID=UPI00186430E2|nr:transmembrane protein 179B [Megalops cyprinoides]
MLAMTLPWLLVLELVMYAGCFICGIITAALLTITQGHFSGQCLLYGSVQYNATAQALGLLTTSSPSLCYFVSSISVCVAIYCFSLILFWIYTSFVEDEVKRESLWVNVTLGVCGVFLFLLLVSGCILRIGRDRLCLSVLHNVPSIASCAEAESKTWMRPGNGGQFYTWLHSAEKSVWVNFFFWVLIVAVVMVQRRQASGYRSSGDDADWSSSETEPFFHRPSRPQ